MTTAINSARTHWSRNRGYATLVLIAATVIWGSTFAVVDYVVHTVPVHRFLAIRFIIALVCLLAVRPRALRGLSKQTWRRGIIIGIALGIGYFLQTQGQDLGTVPTVAAFITGLFVVLTPLLAAWWFKTHIGPVAWVSIAIATIGLAGLTLKGGRIDTGAIYVLGCALAFAIQIVLLARWSTPATTVSLVAIQILVTAFGEIISTSIFDGAPSASSFNFGGGQWLAIAFLAVFATVVCFLAQTWAQGLMPATQAAVIMTAEPLFATLTGTVLHERITALQIGGGALVLAAMYIAELAPARLGGRESAEAALPHLEP